MGSSKISSNTNSGKEQPTGQSIEVTFDELFLENVQPNEGEKLARQMGLINEAGKWIYKTKEKQLAALWWTMKERNMVRTNLIADSKAVQIVARQFGISAAKNVGTKFIQSEILNEAKTLLRE